VGARWWGLWDPWGRRLELGTTLVAFGPCMDDYVWMTIDICRLCMDDLEDMWVPCYICDVRMKMVFCCYICGSYAIYVMYVLKCRGNASKTEKERKKNSQVCRWPAVGKPEITCQQIPGLPTASQAVGKMTITLPMAGRRQK